MAVQNVYSVAQVNAYIKNMFTQDFMLQRLCVRGEVSNCKYHPSGHIYFTLKDEKGTIACVMFDSDRKKGLSFRMQEGLQVIVKGTVNVYERDGKYQIYVKQITNDGLGNLYEKFEELKTELLERGMFDGCYKRPVPKYIHTLGVVTAPTGAAVRDIINITRRRNPYVKIILYPAIVQGKDAAPSIINGIRALEKIGVDVMIVGRGGGSLEDLWAFNEEAVAQAIFDCEIPIISAVGHETDTTIADYVADLRAPTPSAAAELAVYEYDQLEKQLARRKEELTGGVMTQIQLLKMKTAQRQLTLKTLSPMNRLQEQKMYLAKLTESLQGGFTDIVTDRRHRLALLIEQFKGLSPLEKLSGGYSYVEKDGRAVKSVEDVAEGDKLTVQVTDGEIHVLVEECARKEREPV